MDLITQREYDMHAAFQEVRKRSLPEGMRQALLEHFMESPDVIAIMAEARITKPIDGGILGAMVMAFVAGCNFSMHAGQERA